LALTAGPDFSAETIALIQTYLTGELHPAIAPIRPHRPLNDLLPQRNPLIPTLYLQDSISDFPQIGLSTQHHNRWSPNRSERIMCQRTPSQSAGNSVPGTTDAPNQEPMREGRSDEVKGVTTHPSKPKVTSVYAEPRNCEIPNGLWA